MKRDLGRLETQDFDVLVIGGGILGACAVWDAAQRGLRAALVERDDFASGNSSNNLKIVHGGFRHLQRLQLRRVREAAAERSTWLRLAPHLVEPLPVLIPSVRHGLQRAAVLAAAAALNDLLTGDRNRDLPPGRVLPRARALSRRECLDLVPELDATGLTGGVVFYDAQLYSPERLVLEVIEAAHLEGAVVANYVEAMGPLLHDGRIVGVQARDRLAGGTLDVRARVLINAAGPAVGRLTERLDHALRAAALPHSVALNFVTRSFGHRAAFAFPGAPERGTGFGGLGRRQLFMAPWRERSLIGTAHLALDGDPADPSALGRYVERFLEEVNGGWPGTALTEQDLLTVHRGPVPLGGSGSAATRLLPWHRIVDHGVEGRPELISAISAKFTTGRLAAQEAVDLAVAKLGRIVRPCRTAQTPLPGAPAETPAEALVTAQRRHGNTVDAEALEHLVRTYGKRCHELIARVAADPELGLRVRPEAPVLKAAFVHGVEAEMAHTLEDLIWRRTELGPRGLASDAVAASASDFASARPMNVPSSA